MNSRMKPAFVRYEDADTEGLKKEAPVSRHSYSLSRSSAPPRNAGSPSLGAMVINGWSSPVYYILDSALLYFASKGMSLVDY